MSAGGSFNTMYTDFGNNEGDAIILTVDISSGDDSAKIVNKYKANGPAPEFPIVLTTGNSKAVANLFGEANYGGPTWIMHPDREFVKTDYSLTTMKTNLQAALDDDCNNGGTKYSLTVNNGSGSGDYAEGTSVPISANTPEDGYVFEAWIGDTQYVSSFQNAATTITMPAKAITIEATFRDTTNDNIDTSNAVSVMYYAGWEGLKDTIGSTIDVDSSKLKSDTLISAAMAMKTSNEAEKEWAWVKLTAFLENSLEEITALKVIYEADDTVALVLDQSDLSDAGTSFLYTLVPTSRGSETKLLTETNFSQPDWHSGSDKLDLSKVNSISFAATREGSSLSLTIHDLVLYNYTPTNSVIASTQQSKAFKLVTADKNATLTVPEAGVYTISVLGVNGRVLASQKKHCISGPNRCILPQTAANTVQLIQVKGANKTAIFKSLR